MNEKVIKSLAYKDVVLALVKRNNDDVKEQGFIGLTENLSCPQVKKVWLQSFYTLNENWKIMAITS